MTRRWVWQAGIAAVVVGLVAGVALASMTAEVSAIPPPGKGKKSETAVTITKYHTPEADGLFTSIAIGSDGLPIVSFHDDSTESLKVAHCEDISCTQATISTIDTLVGDGNLGAYTSIAIGQDGLALITYHSQDAADGKVLKAAHCSDLACTAATISIVDATNDSGFWTSVAIGADGLPLISYKMDGGDALRVAHCNDVLCQAATVSIIDVTVSPVGVASTSIAIGGDGLGLISYVRGSSVLAVAHCDDALCSTASVTLPGGNASEGTSIAIGSDGLGLIVYAGVGGGPRVRHCDDPACSTSSEELSQTAGAFGDGSFPSISIGPDGLGFISYRWGAGPPADGKGGLLAIAHCEDVTCSDVIQNFADSEFETGGYTSVAFGTDGLPVISYWDKFRQDLKIAHCSRLLCE